MKVFGTLLLCSILSFSSLKAEDSLSLYVFLLDDCPICIQYTPTINQLYSEYGSRIGFAGYFPNFSSKKHKIETFQSKYSIQFPLFTDYFKEKAKQFNAQVTPEVVLYNHDLEEVIYQGRIDNTFYKLGRRRNVVTEHDLKTAIEQTLKNEPVLVRTTQPVGCFINYSDNLETKMKKGKE
ncbi:MAG: hypothetical protein AAGA77_19890 [Bacteroidota bacterium]